MSSPVLFELGYLPFLIAQVGLCEQLLSHLSKYQQQEKEAPSTSSSAKEAPPAEAAAAFEGMKAVKKQDTSDGFEGVPQSFCF